MKIFIAFAYIALLLTGCSNDYVALTRYTGDASVPVLGNGVEVLADGCRLDFDTIPNIQFQMSTGSCLVTTGEIPEL